MPHCAASDRVLCKNTGNKNTVVSLRQQFQSGEKAMVVPPTSSGGAEAAPSAPRLVLLPPCTPLLHPAVLSGCLYLYATI